MNFTYKNLFVYSNQNINWNPSWNTSSGIYSSAFQNDAQRGIYEQNVNYFMFILLHKVFSVILNYYVYQNLMTIF